jgi:hypothetical protein
LEDDEVEMRESKREKMTKMLGLVFQTHLIENESQSYFEAMFYPKALFWNKVVNNEIEFIMHNHI